MNQEDQSNEYQIVWFEPNIDSEENKALKKTLEENKSTSLFSEVDKMSEFCKSINMSFLLIVPNEKLRVKELDKTKYHRRLANFEEEAVLMRFLKEIPTERPRKVYVFFPRKDFEEEIVTKEEIEKMMRPSEVNMTESSKDFREELISWEHNPRGPLYEPGKSDNKHQELVKKDYLECKEWCIRGLKELVFQRKREKLKMMYYVTLAESQANLGEDTEALENHVEVVDAFRAVYGGKHPSTASGYNNVAMVHYRMEDNQQAQDYHTKALKIRKAIYGETNSFTGGSYNNLGLVFERLGQSDKAIKHITKAAEIYKAVYGELHSYTATLYTNLGHIFHKLKKYQKALEYHMKAHEVRKSLYGEQSSFVADSYINVGGVYESLQDYEKAIDCLFQAAEIRKFNNQDSEAAALYYKMGVISYRFQDYQRAADSWTKALDIRESESTNKESLFLLYNNLGSVYQTVGEYQKTLEHLMKALRVAKSLFGEIHPRTETVYKNIADAYKKLGDLETSTDYLVKSLSLAVFRIGEMDFNVSQAYFAFAAQYSQLEKWEKSLYCCAKARNIQRFFQEEDHHSTEETYRALGRLFPVLEEQQKELIYDKKSLKLEKFLPGSLARKFRKKMANGDFSCEKFFSSRRNRSEEASESEADEEEDEVSEASNDHLIGNHENNERIDFLHSPTGNDNEEDNSILGKRNAPSEDSEGSEPDVEKKIKQ